MKDTALPSAIEVLTAVHSLGEESAKHGACVVTDEQQVGAQHVGRLPVERVQAETILGG